MNKRVLHLTLKKKWFDMIVSGEKLEEYREIKPYWFTRLVFQPEKVKSYYGVVGAINQYSVDRILTNYAKFVAMQPYDEIEFINGYKPTSPRVTFTCEGISIGLGLPKWGAELDKEYFIIKIGHRIK